LFWKQNESGPDEEYMYGLTTAGDIVLVQRYVFDPLIEVLSEQGSKGDLSSNVQADVSIPDTTLVTKIFIVDN